MRKIKHHGQPEGTAGWTRPRPGWASAPESGWSLGGHHSGLGVSGSGRPPGKDAGGASLPWKLSAP